MLRAAPLLLSVLQLAHPLAAQDQVPMLIATGTFDVRITPLPADSVVAGTPIGRLALDKDFHGDISATSHGVMLAIRTAVEGSAAYSALEQVSGTVAGRSGSFVLQHTGTMHAGNQHLVVTIVPGSGTGELAGIMGMMEIIIEGGEHRYRLQYTLDG